MQEDRLQKIISDDLFSSSPSIADIPQVLRFMEPHAQPISGAQLKAIAYLNYLGMRPMHEEYRKKHNGKHPYSDLVKWIIDSAVAHSDPGVYLRTIEALIPPDQQIQMSPAAPPKKRGRKGV